MNTSRAMVIVGAGHVGGRAAAALREFGWTGPIELIGAESPLPYERPPLSKGVLTGDQDTSDCALLPAALYAQEGIRHRPSTTVCTIHAPQREVELHTGERIAYEALLIATGGNPRPLRIPGAHRPGVLSLRTLADATALRDRLRPGAHIVIIGGGFIGLEVAASAREIGAKVTVLEGAQRLLERAVPASVAHGVLALHRSQGVDIRLGQSPESIAGLVGGALAVHLSNGTTLPADTVVVGIGIEPSVALAEKTGLQVNRGIVVNAELATSLSGIYAAGDVAEFPSPLSGTPIRQETWFNAESQARTAARNMLGGHEVYQALPWFWSDQYDHQLQVMGEPSLATRTVTRPLSAEAQAAPLATLTFGLDATGRLVSASGFGPRSLVVKELKLARLLVERAAVLDPDLLSNPNVKLKPLLAATRVATEP